MQNLSKRALNRQTVSTSTTEFDLDYYQVNLFLRPQLFGWPFLQSGDETANVNFLMYTNDLIPLIQSHGLCPHLYSDDTQINGFCRPSASLELQINNKNSSW